jgi:CRISPR-associated endonuclease Cas2
MMRPILIVYDIFDDHRRERIRALLTPLADRIQQSSWLIPAHCHVNPHHLANGLEPALAPPDRLRIYAPCAHCVTAARWLPTGQPHTLHARSTWIA